MGSSNLKRSESGEVAGDLLQALVAKTLDGDAGAEGDLVRLLTPWIHRCVVATLTHRVAGGLRACSRDEIQDFVQDVMLRLIEDNHAVLRRWDPQRGPLSPYIATVTRHLVIGSLRTKKKNPRTNVRLPDDPAEIVGSDDDLEVRLEAEDYERAMKAQLEKLLSARGLTVLQLTMEGRSIEDIARMAEMTRGAVNSHHSRIRKLAAAIHPLLALQAFKARR